MPAVTIAPGVVRRVELPPGVLGWTGTLVVPEGARSLSVAIHAKDDLDLYLRRGRAFSGDFANEADVTRPAKAPMEAIQVRGAMTAGAWYLAVVRRVAEATPSPFDVIALIDEGEAPSTLVPRREVPLRNLKSSGGVRVRAWFPEGADAITVAFRGAAPPAGSAFQLVGPSGSKARTWQGPLVLDRKEHPAGLYTLIWDPEVASAIPDDAKLRLEVGTPEQAIAAPLRASVAPMVEFDQSLSVRLGGEGTAAWHFRVRVPEGTGGLVVEAHAANERDVDLFLNRGAMAPEDEESADYFSRTLKPMERLVAAGDRPLRPGVYTGTALLVDDEEACAVHLRIQRLPARTRERSWGPNTPQALAMGGWRAGTLHAEHRPLAWYLVTIPAGTRAFHALVLNATAPVELVLARRTDGSVMRRAMSARVDERLELPFTKPPDTPRLFALGVYARDPYDGPVRFRVGVSVGTRPAPPADLRWPPFLDTTKVRPIERACAAVVELTIRGNTGGTATCVTPRGRLLTCRHVLQAEDEDDIQKRGILVAFPQRLDRPPVQSFFARVVAESEETDLAMLEVTGDVFGRPLDPALAFPWLPLSKVAAPRLGDQVSVLGYPADGSDRSRTPIIFSPGVVSGLESQQGALRWIKTDAWISSGHSGGALVDPAGQLVGIPAATLGDLEDLGLAIPVSAIPAAWREAIERETR